MRVLVTRPEPSASRTAETLGAMGHETIVSPLLEIEFTGTPQPAGRFSALVVTSGFAIDAMAAAGGKAELRKLPLFIVGQKSAGQIKRAGYKNIAHIAHRANDMANVLDRWLDSRNNGNLVLYACGEDLAFDLKKALAEKGRGCIAWIVYRARQTAGFSPEAASALRDGTIDAVLLYSARSATIFGRHFDELRPSAKKQPALYAISSNTREALPETLARSCTVARLPDEEHLLQLLPD